MAIESTTPTNNNDALMLASTVPLSSSTTNAINNVNVDMSMEPTMQQLLLQVQAQQAHLQQVQAHADAQAQVRAHLAAAAVTAATSMNLGTVSSPHVNLHAGNEVLSMDLLQPTTINTTIPLPPTTTTTNTVHRKSIPLSMKKEAIEWIMGPGKGIPSRAEKHFSALHWDVSASSFRKWWKNRDRIMNDSSSKKRISGGGRKPYLEDTEEKVLVMVIQERAKKDRVTRKWIATTAQHMFQRNNAAFKASENWVTKFIRRNGLTLKRSYVTYEQEEGGGEHGHEGEVQLEMDRKPSVQEEGGDGVKDDDKNVALNITYV